MLNHIAVSKKHLAKHVPMQAIARMPEVYRSNLTPVEAFRAHVGPVMAPIEVAVETIIAPVIEPIAAPVIVPAIAPWVAEAYKANLTPEEAFRAHADKRMSYRHKALTTRARFLREEKAALSKLEYDTNGRVVTDREELKDYFVDVARKAQEQAKVARRRAQDQEAKGFESRILFKAQDGMFKSVNALDNAHSIERIKNDGLFNRQKPFSFLRVGGVKNRIHFMNAEGFPTCRPSLLAIGHEDGFRHFTDYAHAISNGKLCPTCVSKALKMGWDVAKY